MISLELDPDTTALVLIDLQQGIVTGQTTPHAAGDVVGRAVRLARCFRERGALVVLVHVDPGSNGELFPSPQADQPRPVRVIPPGWTTDRVGPGPRARRRGGHQASAQRVLRHRPRGAPPAPRDPHHRARRDRDQPGCRVHGASGTRARVRAGVRGGRDGRARPTCTPSPSAGCSRPSAGCARAPTCWRRWRSQSRGFRRPPVPAPRAQAPELPAVLRAARASRWSAPGSPASRPAGWSTA